MLPYILQKICRQRGIDVPLLPGGPFMVTGYPDGRSVISKWDESALGPRPTQKEIDSVDAVALQAEVEAEEKAVAEKAAALETLADWMQRNPTEATKLLEMPAKVAVIETKVAALESTAAVKP